jgi:hypothetical protein
MDLMIDLGPSPEICTLISIYFWRNLSHACDQSRRCARRSTVYRHDDLFEIIRKFNKGSQGSLVFPQSSKVSASDCEASTDKPRGKKPAQEEISVFLLISFIRYPRFLICQFNSIQGRCDALIIQWPAPHSKPSVLLCITTDSTIND